MSQQPPVPEGGQPEYPMPIDQSGYPGTGPFGAPPQKPKRRTGMLVTGIILLVIGGLVFLGQLASRANGRARSIDNGAELGGFLTAAIVMMVVPVVVGILLIVKSGKPKPPKG